MQANERPASHAPADATAEGAHSPSSSPPPSERRRRRSEDPVTALHYQLAAARTAGLLEAVVLVDDSGCLVAGAGAWPVCEELAAYAPLLANPHAVASASVGSRVAALSPEVEVRSLDFDGAEVLLCGRGGAAARSDSMSRAAVGCLRILRAAA